MRVAWHASYVGENSRRRRISPASTRVKVRLLRPFCQRDWVAGREKQKSSHDDRYHPAQTFCRLSGFHHADLIRVNNKGQYLGYSGALNLLSTEGSDVEQRGIEHHQT